MRCRKVSQTAVTNALPPRPVAQALLLGSSGQSGGVQPSSHHRCPADAAHVNAQASRQGLASLRELPRSRVTICQRRVRCIASSAQLSRYVDDAPGNWRIGFAMQEIAGKTRTSPRCRRRKKVNLGSLPRPLLWVWLNRTAPSSLKIRGKLTD